MKLSCFVMIFYRQAIYITYILNTQKKKAYALFWGLKNIAAKRFYS